MTRRRLLAGIAAAGALALTLSACGGGRAGVEGQGEEAGDNQGALIGVAMPTKTSERWIDDGDNVKEKLEELATRSTCSTPTTRFRTSSSSWSRC